MKVLVTGGSGFLGSHVAEQLSSAGHRIVALVRKTSNRKFLSTLANVELAEGSVEDRAAVDRAMAGVDAVVHAAGLVKARTVGVKRIYSIEPAGLWPLRSWIEGHMPRTGAAPDPASYSNVEALIPVSGRRVA